MKKFRNNEHHTGGYVALMATIVLSAMLLIMALEGGMAGYHARFNILGTEAKEQATALAQGCADQALSAILTNPAYVGDTLVNTDAGTCQVYPIEFNTPAAGIVTIRAQADVRGSFANLEMQMNMSDIHIDSIPDAPTKGTLVVITNVVNDGNGFKSANDFAMHVSGNNPSDTSFPGDEAGVPITVDGGSYSITQTPETGYSTSVSTNCAGTISAGEIKFCTVSNNDITTTLTVIVNVHNDDAGTLTISDFSLKLNGATVSTGQRNTVTVGSHNVTITVPSGYVASDWGYQCSPSGNIVINEGDNKTCIVNVDDVEPPTPECSDTVMMLDRTGSMTGTDLTNERNAGRGILDLYKPLSPLPQVGIGVFGAVGASDPYLAAIVQTLTTGVTTPYDNAYTALTNSLSTSGGYTNLQSAISVADGELNSVRHLPSKEKVMILLSDGGANRPSGSTSFDTGYHMPTFEAQNGPSDLWTSASSAYTGGEASDDSGHRHQYSNLGFTVPVGATIAGIDTRVTGFSYGVATSTAVDTFGTGITSATVSGWTENPTGTSNPQSFASTGSGNDSASPDGGRFAWISGNSTTANRGSICKTMNASGLSGLILNYYWRGDTAALNNEFGIVEYNTSGGCPSSGWNTLVSHQLDAGDANSSAWSSLQSLALPASLDNDNSFSIRFRNNTNLTSKIFRVDAVNLSGSSQCTLGADLSWNGGGSWSNEKTQTLGASSTVYTLGNATDKWGSHTWVQNDISDANFRLRIRQTNPGPECRVDTLETRIHYTLSVDPKEAALIAADAAKQNGTTIFTIHFGSAGVDKADQNFLAWIATGNTSTSTGHESGSFNDPGGSITADTGLVSPIADEVTTGGDNNGFEEGPDDAYGDDIRSAQNNDGAGDRHLYSGYNFNIPPNATITGIRVRPDWWVEDIAGTNSVGVELSFDGGTTWTASQSQGTESTTDTNNKFVGGSTNTWGRTWTNADFAADKFRVRVTSNSTVTTRDFYLDWIPVQVYYTVIGENGDNDNFFISPTSADMPGIFKYIGEQVCPAVGFAAVTVPPTDADLKVITQVINNNGGTKTAGQIQMHVTPGSASPNSFVGLTGGKDVTLNPGTYKAYGEVPLGYIEIPSATCSSVDSGNIEAGESRVCVLTYDDVPTPPAPPNLNINIGSWQEVPTVAP